MRSDHGLCCFNILYLRLKVIQHDDVCSSSGSFPALLCRAALHLDLTAEATQWPGSSHSLHNKQDFGWSNTWTCDSLKSHVSEIVCLQHLQKPNFLKKKEKLDCNTVYVQHITHHKTINIHKYTVKRKITICDFLTSWQLFWSDSISVKVECSTIYYWIKIINTGNMWFFYTVILLVLLCDCNYFMLVKFPKILSKTNC